MSLPDMVDEVRRAEGGARRRMREWFDTASPPHRDEALDALAVSAAAGSRPALELLLELIHRHRLALPPITAILVDPADIDDAVQIALIAVAERVAQFAGQARFRSWLAAIARNEALQVLRRKRRRTEPSGAELPEHDRFVRRLSSLVADQQAVAQALDQIAEPYRQALVLREIEELTYDEIASRLGVPVGTVRSRIARAREQLSEQVWQS